ncbi:DivIVA domain-containing protein [Serinicoccus kebangsaanensis]|uniref:DivIVA domain-containing protein n=1 Tax=Serinicoccus kebangsaanensis TaxID=2602069 RepID=UPI00124D37EC|nr:DivIVA domain-containing protein [Serinicoccus kebangsaanensis]
MALSPEDVIKKSFSATHLRRGYDETQVDDFLDEVVVELRRLVAENDGLRTDLEDCRAGGGSMAGAASTATDEQLDPRDADAAAPAGADSDVESLRRQLAECQEARAAAEQQLAQAQERVAGVEQERDELRTSMEQVAAVGADQPDAEVSAAGGEDPSSIISLAQRLHDQHVAEGESAKARLIEEGDGYKASVVAEADERSAELLRTGQESHDRLVHEGQAQHDELLRTGQESHDRLVQEGQAQHDELVSTGEQERDRLVGEGQSNHDQMISEAESQRTSVLEDLHGQESALASTISGLQTQENDLRQRLRAFLTDQMERLDGTTRQGD